MLQGGFEGGVKGGTLGAQLTSGHPLGILTGGLVGAGLGAMANKPGENVQTARNLIHGAGSPQVTASYINPAQQKVQSETNQRLAEIRRGGITGMTANKLRQAYKNAALGKKAAHVGAAEQAYKQGQENIKTGIGMMESEANRKAQIAASEAGGTRDPNKELNEVAKYWAEGEGKQTLAGFGETMGLGG